MSETNLIQQLRANEIGAEELSQLALEVFGGAWDNGPDEVLFGRGVESFELKLKYKKGGSELLKILPGPNLDDAKLAKLISLITNDLDRPEYRVAFAYLFSTFPVNGWYRYADWFQVLPVPRDAPKPVWFDGHPLILQFRYRCPADTLLGASRQLSEVRKIRLLLSTLLEDRLTILKSNNMHWVREGAESCAQRHSGYQIRDTTFLQGGDFAAPTDCQPLSSVEATEYYSRSSTIPPNRGLELPSNLTEMIQQYLSCPPPKQDQFLRAAFWLDHARDVWRDSATAAFLALTSSIESLLPVMKADKKCPVCEREIGKGSVRRLSEFFESYVPDWAEFHEARTKLRWGLRSAWTHGGSLAVSDKNLHFASLTSEAIQQSTVTREMWRLVDVVLVNWLYSQRRLLTRLKQPRDA